MQNISQNKKNKGESVLGTEEYLLLKEQHQTLQDRYTALFKLNQLSHDCAELSDFFKEVHQVISSLMIAENFYICMYDHTFATLEFVYHVDQQDEAPIGAIDYQDLSGSLTHLVIESGQPLLATPSSIQQLSEQELISKIGAQGTDWLGVPLISDNFVIGVMSVQSYDEKQRYEEQDLELLTYTAQHVVTAMVRLQDRERLQKAVNARTKELMQQIRDREKSELLQESLYRISEITNDASIDVDHFYSHVHNVVGQLINAANFFIAKLSKESEILTFVYYSDQNSEDLTIDFQPRKLGSGYTELVIEVGKTLLLNNDDMVRLHNEGKTHAPQRNTYSWLGVPLIHNGEILGAMVIQSYRKDISYNQQDAELLNFVAQHVAIAIKRRETQDFERKAHDLLEQQVQIRTAALEEEIKQRRQVEEQLQYSASHDSLTGLPNRKVFLDLLNHAIACRKRRKDFQFAVLFLDLDRFKVVNDSLGHHAGDALLKIVAQELRIVIRDKDTVARLGGDEFVILIEDLESENEALDVAQRITELLQQPFTIEKQPVFIGTSIGLLFSDDRYEDADFMLRDADTAMYHAKDSGKGRYEVFDSSMHNKVQNALSLEVDLREAIQKNEFTPYFQPIVHLENRKVIGFEALARWNSPKRGFVFPDDFIPLAEETGLVIDIDMLIIEKACWQLKRWSEELGRDDLYISCNMYCDHFFSESLAKEMGDIIDRVGIKASQIRVELTERALLENSDTVLNNMTELKALGVKILLDDFGTGYSSLSYLHRFPVDVLKIDRSFISNINQDESHRAIIKAIIDLATNLQMATVGEGIENLADAKFLTQMECRYGQGYYFAKPMPGEDTFSYLLENH